MKNILPLWTMSGLLIAFCFGPVATGADLTPRQKPKDSPSHPMALEEAPQPPPTETTAMLGQSPCPMPKTPQDFSIINTSPTPPTPILAPVAPQVTTQTIVVADPATHAELDRLAAEIQAMRKDIPKKPDTKKAWAAPRVSGRLFLDSVNVMGQNEATGEVHRTSSDDPPVNLPNAAGFRELRLGASGSGYDSFDYKIEVGFTGNDGRVTLIDNWVGAKHIPLLGYVRAGHFKPETGLYYPMSSNDISLMEYTTSANIFGLGRRIGISSENTFANDRVRLFFGVFQSGATDTARYLSMDNQGQIVNIRLTAAPIFEQEGRHLLHLGGHWEYVGTQSPKTATIGAAPAAFGFGFTQTLRSGSFGTDCHNRGGLEFAYQHGPFSLRSEGFAASYDARNLYGTYIELGWFLTGEHRTYDLLKGSFGGVKPKKNFRPFKKGDCNLIDGLGAWQAVFQWSYIDMNDWRANSSLAGFQHDLVFGLNWHWTPQLRWVFEYVHSMQCVGDTEHSHPTQDIFGTGVRVNF